MLRSSKFLVVMFVFFVAALFGGIKPGRLRCEYLKNPLGVDVKSPRLSWIVTSVERDQCQVAYQLLAAESKKKLSAAKDLLWNTGRVKSSETLNIIYKGRALEPGIRVFWKVRVWDRDDKVSSYSKPAWWEMGLLEPGNFKGLWITSGKSKTPTEEQFYGDNPAPMFRREFDLAKGIKRARAYVSGLGYYDFYLNGKRVGNRLLDPAWTSYGKRVFYSVYDVTGMVKKGKNAAGMIIGNGWYNPLPLHMWGWLNLRDHLNVGRPRAFLQLQIEYEDGSSRIVATDKTWKSSDSPVLRNSVYLGERYDARNEQEGWNRPGFDDGKWEPVQIASESIGRMQAQPLPPIKVIRTIKAVAITSPEPGIYIFDMGENFAGCITLHVKGKRGTSITLRYGELLQTDGKLNGMTSVCGQIKRKGAGGPGAPSVAWQEDSYILKGKGEETYTPGFTFHGFRYVEVKGYPGKPELDAIEGKAMSTALDRSGSFSCSNKLFNRIQSITCRTFLSNFFSVQSDCPHREKFGYGGDIVASSEAAMFNFDMISFYSKVVHDFADAAGPGGALTETAPYVGISGGGVGDKSRSGPIGWGTVQPLLLRQLYQYYGDKRLIGEQYDLAVKWLDRLEANAKDLLITRGIGDHESLAKKPTPLTSTAFFYYNAKLLSRLAAVLGLLQDQERFSALAESVKAAFNKRFLAPGSGIYDSGTQACQVFALFMDLVPASERQPAIKQLVKDIEINNKGHLSTGIFGTKYMLDVLSENGEDSVSCAIVNQKSFPGWGYMLEKGATTLWEHWAFSDNTFSHNHPMFGSVSEWFYKHVGGIQPDPCAKGFDKIIIRPCRDETLSWAKAVYNSIRGPVRSEWKKGNNGFTLNITVPANTSATVFVPCKKGSIVLESGKAAATSKGVEFLRQDDRGYSVFRVKSGFYSFLAR